MNTGKKSGFRHDGAHRLGVTAIDALSGIEDRVSDDVLF